MNITEKIELTKKNIRQAINDYWKHTSFNSELARYISNDFINNLAADSVRAKEPLRNMLRKSPLWNEELDALIIDANSTHNPDSQKILDLSFDIMKNKLENSTHQEKENILDAVSYFSTPIPEKKAKYLETLKAIAPNAYAPGKKPSRIFKSLCDALGVTDNTANSDFQRLFAQIADELSAKQLHYKLYVSINPAHFLTMSNPKEDERGSCLTSCHSFNSTEYEYNNGCTGYARDSVTMIAFTVSDDSNPETLNNRKTTRQLFMYEPGNGVLLQSRMYNTSGGTYGAQAESKVYRSLIQQQIAFCENAIDYWYTFRYYNNKHNVQLDTGYAFNGYPDWQYNNFNAMVSIRKDHTENFHNFLIGTKGLCIACGYPTGVDDGLFCDECIDNYCGDDYIDDDYDE